MVDNNSITASPGQLAKRCNHLLPLPIINLSLIVCAFASVGGGYVQFLLSTFHILCFAPLSCHVQAAGYMQCGHPLSLG